MMRISKKGSMGMNNIEKLIDQWLTDHREEMIDELKLWVSQPSVSRADLGAEGAPFGPDCRKMLDLALERGRHYGFDTKDYDGYCGSILSGEGNPENEIGFVLHLDVVPEGDHWIYQPYQPVVKDGYMIGRGCSDNKGPAILCLNVMRFFKENQIPLKHSLRLMGGCAEETGMADFEHYINVLHGPIPQFSLVADASFPACFAQKGGFDAAFVIPAGKNILSFDAGLVRNAVPDTATAVISGISLEEVQSIISEIDREEVRSTIPENDKEEVQGTISKNEKVSVEATDKADQVKIIGHGKAGHAAFPAHGQRNNAIVNLAEALTELEKKSRLDLGGAAFLADAFTSQFGEGMQLNYADEESGELTINAGVIHKQGDTLLLEIDIRYPVTDTAEEIEKKLRSHIEKIGGQLLIRRISKPYYLSKDDRKVKALMEVYKQVTGDDTPAYAMGGGTYSRVVPDAITFGPGFRKEKKADFLPAGHGGAHGPDEVLCLEDWFTAFKIYVLAVAKLDEL